MEKIHNHRNKNFFASIIIISLKRKDSQFDSRLIVLFLFHAPINILETKHVKLKQNSENKHQI